MNFTFSFNTFGGAGTYFYSDQAHSSAGGGPITAYNGVQPGGSGQPGGLYADPYYWPLGSTHSVHLVLHTDCGDATADLLFTLPQYAPSGSTAYDTPTAGTSSGAESTAPTTTNAPPPTPPASATCPAYYLIDSRGSGESANVSKPGAVLLKRLRDGSRLGRVDVKIDPYPAVGVLIDRLAVPNINGLGSWLKIGHLGAYHDSVVDGKKWLTNEIRSLANSSCSSSALILDGYSQGAQVTGDVFTEMTRAHDPAIRHVVGVVLFGDPVFNPADHVADRGGFSASRYGVLGKRAILPTTARVYSYCHGGDPVCQGSGYPFQPSEHLNYDAESAREAAAKLILALHG